MAMHLHRRRPTLAALLLTCALAAAGCNAGHTSTQLGRVADANSVVVAVPGSGPTTLDFTRTAGAAIRQALMGNVYEGLTHITDSGEIEPWLATHWDISPDGLTYTFTLRPEVTFSNGDPFTAESVKFSLDRVRSDAWTNGLKKSLEMVDTVEVLDPLHVRLHLSTPSNDLLWNLGLGVGAMMTPSAVADLDGTAIGTGPYAIDQFTPAIAISFQPREDYWGPAPRNTGAALRYFTDPTGSFNALQSGDVDAVYALQSPELLDALRTHGGYDITVGTTNAEVLLAMNNRNAPLNDVRVRQAIMYAINRQDVIDTAWDGYGVDTGGAPVAPTDPWYRPSTRYPFDPDKARELLAEAGAQGAELRLAVPSLPYAQGASELVVSQLRDVGLNVTIEAQEFPAVWLDKTYKNHDYDLSIIGHVEAHDVAHMFGDPDYYVGFDDPQTQEEFAAADTGPRQQQVEHMERAVARLMDQAASDTLFNLPNIVVTRPGVSGVTATSAAVGLEVSTLSKNAAVEGN